MKFFILILGPLAAWVLKKARRDYKIRGRLSTKASTAGWILYITHLFTTLAAALRSTFDTEYLRYESEVPRFFNQPEVIDGQPSSFRRL